ncbi:MAG: adenylate/guanylate cyclase domain-containing protein [Actinomycetota bacterium]|nr:adenylate/guanylate cyclase domain-containing protein [Actinomycetota bacterium]
MATRLAATIVAVSLVSLGAAAVVGAITGVELGRDLGDDRLVALRESGARDVASYTLALRRSSETLAASPQAAAAIEAFSVGFDELEGTAEVTAEQRDEVIEHHRETYVEPLAEAGRDVEIRDVVVEDPAALHLQYRYAVDLGVVDEAEALDDARDATPWTEAHARVHPVYRDVVERRDLLDLLLVRADDATVVYSVAKHPELGTSLSVGPFGGSPVAAAANQAIGDPDGGVVITDVGFYDAVPGVPVVAAGAPVVQDGELYGAIVLLVDARDLTDLLTADQSWDSAGFPPTGQTYLVGADSRLRSEPRGYLEDPVAFLDDAVAAASLSEADREEIDAVGTPVLLVRVPDEAFNAAVAGDVAVDRRPTIDGVDGYGTVGRVPSDDVEWWVVSEVDAEAVEADLIGFQELLVVGTAAFVVIFAFVAVAWANRTLEPIRRLSAWLSDDGPPVELDRRSPREFRELTESFEAMSSALAAEEADLSAARARRLALLHRMLPPTVAARVAAGETQPFDEAPKATVGVLLVGGLGDLVRHDGDAGRQVVTRLHTELGELAERHGVDRVKVLGDAYVVACGHDRALIDHAPRVVAFAADAQDAVRELGRDTAANLDISAGISTGPVVGGMAGGSRLVYDVWGETVTVAHQLARRAPAGEILATEETRVMLPAAIEMSALDLEGGPPAWRVATATVGGPA